MNKILISYRRDDSPDATGRIYDRLATQFGKEVVFRDVDSIPLGVDFRMYLEDQVSNCSIFLAIIGKEWVKKRGSKKKSHLNDPKDFVRIEVECALKHQIPVIPLLVRGASIPKAESLPAGMKDLAFRHGILVRSDPDFHNDMDRLIEHLTGHYGLSKTPTAQESTEFQSQEGAGGEVTPAQANEKMVLIPKGPFLYGNDHQSLTIDYDYFMGIFPVTNQHYAPFIRAGGHDNQAYWSKAGWNWKGKKKVSHPLYWGDPKWNQSDHPVVGVSYFEAEAFAKWAGKRLPTEQEWEKAARGTDGQTYPWGVDFDQEKCTCNKPGVKGTAPVTQYATAKSPFGCHDMAGNVWEWCASWYDGELDGRRVIRGGSWFDIPENLRSSNRRWDLAGDRYSTLGFRLVRDIP